MRPIPASLTLSLLGLVLAGCGAQSTPARQSAVAPVTTPSCCVTWAQSASSLAGMRRQSPLIVRATVVRRRTGPRLGERSPTLGSTLVEMRVERVLKGRAPETITVFRNGEPSEAFPDSPRYGRGERYLLGLRATRTLVPSRRVWVPVGPDAVLMVTGTKVGTFVDGAMRAELRKLPASTALKETERALVTPSGA